MKGNNKKNIKLVKSKKSAEYIIENKNELLKKRRRKKAIKRGFLFITLLIGILVTLCLKLPYFNISYVDVKGNYKIPTESIKELSQVKIGTNIFYTNTRAIRTNVKKDPYILDVKVSREFPNRIKINVNERSADYYGISDKGFLILDKEGRVLEQRSDLGGMNLIKVEGFDFNKVKPGDVLPHEDERQIKLIDLIGQLIKSNKSDVKLSSINLKDITDIKVYSGYMEIRLGTSENVRDKLNKAINILSNKEFQNKKGYVDVSFKGNPVVHVE